jgi:hypothetical protein
MLHTVFLLRTTVTMTSQNTDLSSWDILYIPSTMGTRVHHREFFFYYCGLCAYLHCGQSWPIVPASGDSEDDCGEADGM